MEKPRILILGAGVAGLRIAKKLKRKLGSDEAELLLVDQNDYHQLLYRLHKVCNYRYYEKDIIVPLKKIIREIEFKQAKVTKVDIENDIVQTETGEIPYDFLVLSMGSHPAFFNIEGIRENSQTLGSYEDSKKIREKIFELFEEAEKQKKSPPKIVIGGAGFTGVELAGEICDSLPELYAKHGFSRPEKAFSMVEAFPTILPGWNEKLVEKGIRLLKSKGVELILDNPIVKVEKGKVHLKNGVVECDLFIWTGGVEGDPVCGDGFEFRSRRIVVDKYLQYPSKENVFIAGDQACTLNLDDKPLPPNAHIAMMQGDIVADNLVSKLRGQPMKEYKYEHAGEVVTFGKTYAVGEVFGINLVGLPAKIMKQFIHVWYLYSIGGLGIALEYF